jgi:dihydroneopterin aldolase
MDLEPPVVHLHSRIIAPGPTRWGKLTGVNDRIELRGLRAMGLIGVLPEERVRAQPFEIDLDVEADLAAPSASDDLADTVDYGELVSRAVAVVTQEQHQLLERVAGRIAEELLAVHGVWGVTVTIRKLRPPLPYDIASTAVTLNRRRL